MLEVHEVGATAAQTVHVAQLDERRRAVSVAKELQGCIARAKRITYGLLPVGVLVLQVTGIYIYIGVDLPRSPLTFSTAKISLR